MYATLFYTKHRLHRPEIFARYSQYLHHGFVIILTLHDRLECMRHYFVRSTVLDRALFVIVFYIEHRQPTTESFLNFAPKRLARCPRGNSYDILLCEAFYIFTTTVCYVMFTPNTDYRIPNHFLNFAPKRLARCQYVSTPNTDYRLPNHF